jgi:helix-turn-helix protein
MVIPTFERSLDLVIDNDFELSEEEIEQLFQLLSKDKQISKSLNALIESIEPCDNEKNKLKKTLINMVHTHKDSIESLYDAIIKDKNLISYIQEILLKRLI